MSQPSITSAKKQMTCLNVDGEEICHVDNKAAPLTMSLLYTSRWMSHKCHSSSFGRLAWSPGPRCWTSLNIELKLPKVYFRDNGAQNKIEFVSIKDKNTVLNGILERMSINLFFIVGVRSQGWGHPHCTMQLFIKQLFPQINSICVYWSPHVNVYTSYSW